MTAQRLSTFRVEKPWGRAKLWPGFEDPSLGAAPIGEIWFEAPTGKAAELLVKYLFTSERLSIQVHPDDAAARAAGYPRGKEEAWVIVAADPGATIALGTVRPVSRDELRAAALDGSIESLMHWRPVKAGDVIYSSAGTIHAIGAGITLIEVQQNVDLTYRLYDYGRPRELHLDAGIAVSDPVPFAGDDPVQAKGPGRNILVQGQKFVLESWSWAGERHFALQKGLPGWFVPVSGNGQIDGMPWKAGECYLVEDSVEFHAEPGSDMLFAYPGQVPVEN